MPPKAHAILPRDESAAPSDEELAIEVLAGRVELFELIMRRNNQRLYRAIRAYVRDESEIEDILQASYLSAYSHLATFTGGSKLSTWMVRIAINEALGRLRRDKRVVAIRGDRDITEEQPMTTRRSERSPEDEASSHELRTLIESAVDGLPELYRPVFVLREIEGLSTEETATALGVTEDVVKTRLHRAKALLQASLATAASAELGRTFELGGARCDRIVAAVMARIVPVSG